MSNCPVQVIAIKTACICGPSLCNVGNYCVGTTCLPALNNLGSTTAGVSVNLQTNSNLMLYYPLSSSFQDFSGLQQANAMPIGPASFGCDSTVAKTQCTVPAIQFQSADFAWAWSAKVPQQAANQYMFTTSIYINEVLDASVTVTSAGMVVPNVAVHQFGTMLPAGGGFTGDVRDFRLYTGSSVPQFQDRCRHAFGYFKKF
ncbi:hypothetical protein HDU98_006611 [Podochytrium sp. JEL0797]|nr:hypothetical protein HDU98_006611 [Podochytrium sp. JEL0797]